MSFKSILDALAYSGGGNPQMQDIQQMGEGVTVPDAEGYKQMAMGIPAGVGGLPGDIESLGRSIFGADEETLFPTSEDVGSMFGADSESMGFQAGTFLSPDPFGKVLGAATLAVPMLKRTAAKAKVFLPQTSKTGHQKFAQNQIAARNAMDPQGKAQVDAFDPEKFEGKTFMSKEGDMGFSMTEDGYVGHVFKMPGSQKSGALKAAMTKARGEGAKSLDAFDTYLVDQYAKTGAKEVAGQRHAWNPEYATPEMIQGLGKDKPDFVGMEIGGVFDEAKHSQQLGPRPQQDLPRRWETPTGRPVQEPAQVAGMFGPENVQRLEGIAQQGIEQGGQRWYWLGGVLDEFITELGPELGVERFDKMMSYGAAVSPRSAVATEIKRASQLYNRNVGGLSNSPLVASMFDPGYGHLATRTAHAPNVERLERTGNVGTGIEQPKVSSYEANKQGNYQPITVDTHNMQIVSGEARTPKKTEYPYLEYHQKKIAEEMGIDPAEFQSALWVGGGDITGVRNTQNYTQALNQRIAKTAEILDIPEQEAKIKRRSGDLLIKSLVGGIGTGMIADAMMEQNGATQ